MEGPFRSSFQLRSLMSAAHGYRRQIQRTVIAIATPMNSMNVPKLMGTVPGSFRNSVYNPQAIAQPKPNGSTMPARPTLAATFQLLTRNRRSTSSPTRNKKRTRPKFATRLRFGMAAAGNIVFVKPGIRPMTDGPRSIPPMTSAMTRGCLILASGQ